MVNVNVFSNKERVAESETVRDAGENEMPPNSIPLTENLRNSMIV